MSVLWILLRQLSRYGTQIFRRVLGRHARLQSAKHRHRHRCPVLQELVVPVHEGYPVVWPVKFLRAVEPRRSHADYRIGISIDSHGGSDYTQIAVKYASPQLIAQHHIGRRIRSMLVRLVDEPSNLRLHPQQIEIITGDRIAGDTFHRISPPQGRLSKSIKAGHPAEGGVPPP